MIGPSKVLVKVRDQTAWEVHGGGEGELEGQIALRNGRLMIVDGALQSREGLITLCTPVVRIKIKCFVD